MSNQTGKITVNEQHLTKNNNVENKVISINNWFGLTSTEAEEVAVTFL